jgi:hypothetical protein
MDDDDRTLPEARTAARILAWTLPPALPIEWFARAVTEPLLPNPIQPLTVAYLVFIAAPAALAAAGYMAYGLWHLPDRQRRAWGGQFRAGDEVILVVDPDNGVRRTPVELFRLIHNYEGRAPDQRRLDLAWRVLQVSRDGQRLHVEHRTHPPVWVETTDARFASHVHQYWRRAEPDPGTPTRHVLVVDDLRTFPKLRATYARTSDDAIDRLSQREWDEVWLDHDLGAGGDVMVVVEWLEERWHTSGSIPVRQVFVHSANPVGAANVVRALERIVPTKRVNVFEIEHTT